MRFEKLQCNSNLKAIEITYIPQHTQELHRFLAEIRTLQEQLQTAKIAARNASSEADRMRHLVEEITAKAENASAAQSQLNDLESKWVATFAKRNSDWPILFAWQRRPARCIAGSLS